MMGLLRIMQEKWGDASQSFRDTSHDAALSSHVVARPKSELRALVLRNSGGLARRAIARNLGGPVLWRRCQRIF